MGNVLDSLEGLSVKQIGEALYQLDRDNYYEKPVSIEEFVCGSEYLNVEFEGAFYPYWMQQLKKVHPTPIYSPYYEILTSQPIGSGKSTSSLVSLAYEIYKMFCLKDPHAYYKIRPRSVKIVFMLFSSTLGLAGDVNWSILSSYLDCPWFKKCPRFNSTLNLLVKNNMVDLGHGIWIRVGSSSGHALGQAVFGGLLDEADFQKAATANQAMESYLGILRRMESRFLERGGHIAGKLWLVSSPKNETAFLSAHIKAAKQTKNKTTYIVPTRPIWGIKEHLAGELYCGETFRVFIGDDQFDPVILDDDDTRTFAASQIVNVPVEYYDAFQKSLIEAIRDIIGDAIPAATNLFPKPKAIDMVATMPNRITKNYVEFDFYDTVSEISHFCQVDYLKDPMNPESLRFFHVDNAYSKDSLGVSAVYAKSLFEERIIGGRIQLVESNRKDRFYIHDFALCIRRKPSSKEIPFYKLKKFFQWLRDECKYPIGKITFDQFQSKQLMQELEIDGFTVEHLSVDKDKTQYQSLAGRIAQQKILIVNHPHLVKELKELREDEEKIDHPQNGGCFSGCTPVLLSDMSTKRFDELKCGDKLVSWDGMNFVESDSVNPRITKKASDLISFETDDGFITQCTPEHLILLTNGDWVRADELKEGDDIKSFEIKSDVLH